MITSTEYPPCVCGTEERPTPERIAKELTHIHHHNHPYYWGEPVGTMWRNVNHEHNHAHTVSDDHHLVTKAKEGTDV